MEYCERYVGVHCVDGTCPMARKEDHEERGIPLGEGCKDCYLCKGCEDCALKGTDECPKAEAEES